MTDGKNPYEVNIKDCGGCIYLSSASVGHTRTCDYFLRTGKHRTDENTVKDCSEKTLGGKKERDAVRQMEFGMKIDEMKGILQSIEHERRRKEWDEIDRAMGTQNEAPAEMSDQWPVASDQETDKDEVKREERTEKREENLTGMRRQLYVQCAIDLAEEIREFVALWAYAETSKGMLSDEQLKSGSDALESCANYIQYRAAGLALRDSEQWPVASSQESAV